MGSKIFSQAKWARIHVPCYWNYLGKNMAGYRSFWEEIYSYKRVRRAVTG